MIQMLRLKDEDMAYAHEISRARALGCEVSPNDTPDSGLTNTHVHLVGAMAEIAACLHYGEDYREHVSFYRTRPLAIPDLWHDGYRVSVKGRERWESPLDLVVPSYDIGNDIYLLVSVAVESATCGLRGWLTREELLAYPPKGWQWVGDRPGAQRVNKLRRYVPVEELRPCREGIDVR